MLSINYYDESESIKPDLKFDLKNYIQEIDFTTINPEFRYYLGKIRNQLLEFDYLPVERVPEELTQENLIEFLTDLFESCINNVINTDRISFTKIFREDLEKLFQKYQLVYPNSVKQQKIFEFIINNQKNNNIFFDQNNYEINQELQKIIFDKIQKKIDVLIEDDIVETYNNIRNYTIKLLLEEKPLSITFAFLFKFIDHIAGSFLPILLQTRLGFSSHLKKIVSVYFNIKDPKNYDDFIKVFDDQHYDLNYKELYRIITDKSTEPVSKKILIAYGLVKKFLGVGKYLVGILSLPFSLMGEGILKSIRRKLGFKTSLSNEEIGLIRDCVYDSLAYLNKKATLIHLSNEITKIYDQEFGWFDRIKYSPDYYYFNIFLPLFMFWDDKISLPFAQERVNFFLKFYETTLNTSIPEYPDSKKNELLRNHVQSVVNVQNESSLFEKDMDYVVDVFEVLANPVFEEIYKKGFDIRKIDNGEKLKNLVTSDTDYKYIEKLINLHHLHALNVLAEVYKLVANYGKGGVSRLDKKLKEIVAKVISSVKVEKVEAIKNVSGIRS